MAQKSYKVNEAIEIVYQTLNSATGKTINMEVYDESHTLVAGGPTVLTELGTTGRYYGPFTPDAVGEWSVQIEESDGTGKVTKAFSVGTYNLVDVGSQADAIKTDTASISTSVDTVDGKVDTVDTKVSAVDAKVVDLDADVVTVDGKVTTLGTDVATVDTKISAVDTKVDNLDSDIVIVSDKLDGLVSPPMVG